MVDSSGFEPEASALRRQRSSELIYEPTEEKCHGHLLNLSEWSMSIGTGILRRKAIRESMLSAVMYEKLRHRFFTIPPEELSSLLRVLEGGEQGFSVITTDGDEVSYAYGERTVSFNGMPMGRVTKASYTLSKILLEIAADVDGLDVPQTMRWNILF